MDIKFIRGTKEKIVLYVPGDVTDRKLRFVVKTDKELTTDRLIEKNNSLNGGSDAELLATYLTAGNRTKLEIFKDKADDGDFTAYVYYYDVRSISTTDSEDNVRIEQGKVTMDFSVSSDFDGFTLPSSATRFLQIDARGFPADIMIITDTIDGVVVFRTITLEELKQKLDQII